MPITVTDFWYGAKITDTGDAGSVENEYIIQGTNSELAAAAAFSSALASTFGNYVLSESRIVERLGENAWKGYAKWGTFEPVSGSLGLGASSSKYSFEIGGGQTQLMQSLGTTAYVASGTAPDFNNAINVTENGPQGVQIQTPNFSFSETHYLALATVSAAYINTIYTLTGTINNALYKGYAAGELLFLGCTGALQRHDYWELTYRFAASPNATGLSVGPITGISKDGWQYLWTKYRKKEDTTAKAMAAEPLAVYVEDVYESADHSLLGI